MKTIKFVYLFIALCFLGMFAVPAFAGIIYVKSSGTGGGTTWATAYTDLQLALSVAKSGDEIWVAAGTYFPTTALPQ